MLALLADAITILEKGRGATGSRRSEIFDETSAWLARDDARWPCSFVSICDALGLDVVSVRRIIARRGVDSPATTACASV